MFFIKQISKAGVGAMLTNGEKLHLILGDSRKRVGRAKEVNSARFLNYQ